MRSTLNCNVLDQRNWEQDHKIVSTQIHTTCSTKQITIGFGLPHGNLYSSERRAPCVVMIRLPNQHGKSLFVTKSEEDLETNRPTQSSENATCVVATDSTRHLRHTIN